MCQTLPSFVAVYVYEPAAPRLLDPLKVPVCAVIAFTASFTPASATWRALAESPARREPRRPTSTVTIKANNNRVTTMTTSIIKATLPSSRPPNLYVVLRSIDFLPTARFAGRRSSRESERASSFGTAP